MGLEEYRGLDGGLDGGLRGWPDGARAHEGLRRWSMAVGVSPEDLEWFSATILGLSLEEYRDYRRWIDEMMWLEKVTGLNWSLE